MTTCSEPGCTKPFGLPCCRCGASLCWEHSHTLLLIVFCAECWEKYHVGDAAVATKPRTATPSPRSPEPAVGDVCLLPGPGGQHLLIVDIWHADPPATLGRATCLLGARWDQTTATFTPVVPHQSALFGFTGPRSLPFERVGGIDGEEARRIYRDGQTLLAVASGVA
jgi:hypothetical protein